MITATQTKMATTRPITVRPSITASAVTTESVSNMCMNTLHFTYIPMEGCFVMAVTVTCICLSYMYPRLTVQCFNNGVMTDDKE